MRTKCIRLFIVTLLVILAACSAHPRKVDCGGHLKPINAPAPAVPAGSPHP